MDSQVSMSNKWAVKAVGPQKGVSSQYPLQVWTEEITENFPEGQSGAMEDNGQCLQERRYSLPRSNHLRWQGWGSQQGATIVVDQGRSVFPNLNCNYPIYWVCAGLECGAQFLTLWTKRNSIRLVRKDCTSPRGPGHEAECRGCMGLCFDSLGRGLSVSYGRQEGHTCHWLWKTASWAPKSVLFSLGTQMGLYFPVSLGGRCSHVAKFSPVEYEWKWRVPVSGLACADLTCATSHAPPFLTAGCRQEGSRASVLTWGSWTQRSRGSMNLDGKSRSSFSLSLNWNLAFLPMTNADDKLQ